MASNCRNSVGLRDGTFFEKSNYLWVWRRVPFRRTSIYLRDIVRFTPYAEVEINFFRQKPEVNIDHQWHLIMVQHHRGRVTTQEIWVCGMVDTSSTPALGVMVTVPDRSARTLLPIMQACLQQPVGCVPGCSAAGSCRPI